MAGKISRAKAPDYTFKELQYLQQLADDGCIVRVSMNDGTVWEGRIDSFDAAYIQLTQNNEKPNIFLYKQDLKYLIELPPAKPTSAS